MWYYIAVAVLAVLVLTPLTVALVCHIRIFHSPKRVPLGENEFGIPPGEEYEPFREGMIEWIKQVRKMPKEPVSITSFDGLRLVGNYYEFRKGAPLEIMFHGYKGNAERDMSGGVERCFMVGRNALIVDQRASGLSEGSVISFGINEKRDCLSWIDFAIERFGADVKIILTGISMGAATVMMAAGEKLPPNVVSVLADCGYSSAKEIIMKVIDEMGLPAKLLYPFVKLGAKLFGKFDLEETSPLEAMRKCRIPVIFIHGEADGFVPCDMSRRLYAECASEKFLLTVPGAAHGLAFPTDKEGYVKALLDFEKSAGFLETK